MGYYTNYTLSVFEYVPVEQTFLLRDVSPETRTKIDEEVQKMNTLDSEWYCYTTWYECEMDMSLLSEKFPTILFCLHGEGETNGDLWDAYFLNGKEQYCTAEIVYDDFCPEKMVAYPENISRNGRYSYQG